MKFFPNSPQMPPVTDPSVSITMDGLGWIQVDWYLGNDDADTQGELLGWFATARYHVSATIRVSWSMRPVFIEGAK